MTTRWDRIEEIFAAAADLPDGERGGFVAGACGDDAGLRAEVEALLAADRRPRAVLDDDGALVAARVAALRVDPAAIAIDRTICDDTLLSGSGGSPRGGDGGRAAAASLPILSLAEGDAVDAGAGVDRGDVDGARAGAAAAPATADGPDLAVRGTLGEGGMGQVLLAWQRSVGREVAIKTVARDGPAALARALVAEARIAGGLEHPVIPPIHALGRAADGRPLLVMKRIEGTSWAALLADPAHPAWTAVEAAGGDRLAAHVRILGRVADAAHFAHGRGYLHRDLKPDNVMIGGDGEVYLVDWGIALPLVEAAAGAELRGTPQYMAPEMVDGRPLDARSDVFLLGATLHRVLTGAPRHAGATLAEVLVQARHPRPVAYPAAVPAELAALARDATAADPAARPPSARAFRDRLDRFLRHGAAAAVAASALARADELERRLAGTIDPGDPALQRLATEARFGLVEARRLWPDGPAIARGLARAHRLAVRLELRRGNAAAARALLDDGADAAGAGAPDVGPADADADADAVAALRGEVEALERDVVARAARERELSRLAYDLSPEVALRALLLALLLGLGVMVVGLVVATRAGALGRATTQVSGGYVVVGAGLLGIVGAIVLGFWRALSANALARRQVVVAIVTAVLILAERAIAWRDGASYAACATQEYVVIGLAATVTAIFAARIWLVVAAIAGACALLLQLWPGRVMIISQAGLALFAVTLALGAWRAGRRRSQQLDALATDHREDRADLP